MDADTLTRWLALVDHVDSRVTDLMSAKPGDEAPLADYQASIDELREALSLARLDALSAEVRS